MSGYRNKAHKKSKAPVSRFQSLLRKPWLFAGSALGLDIAMLVTGMVLSRVHIEPEYTLVDNAIQRSQPLGFFGVIAAVVLGIICVLTALIIAGAFTKRKRAVQFIGAAALLVVSLCMVGASAVTALGLPPQSRTLVSYTDEELTLLIEEERPQYGSGIVSFFMTDDGQDRIVRLASTDISEYSSDDDRYTVSWVSDNILTVGFQDGTNYRTVQMSVDRTLFTTDNSGTSEA